MPLTQVAARPAVVPALTDRRRPPAQGRQVPSQRRPAGRRARLGATAVLADNADRGMVPSTGSARGVTRMATTAPDEDLAQRRAGDGWPGERTVLECVNVILNEEWAHHQFAVRDLDLLSR